MTAKPCLILAGQDKTGYPQDQGIWKRQRRMDFTSKRIGGNQVERGRGCCEPLKNARSSPRILGNKKLAAEKELQEAHCRK